jgi:hypothetical protein
VVIDDIKIAVVVIRRNSSLRRESPYKQFSTVLFWVSARRAEP